MKRFALFALALALPAATASAQDYFVTLTGSDANTGAITSPWRTVTHAAANAPSGARILVGPGTYGTAGNLEGIEVSGGKKLTILGAGRGKTILQAHAGFSPTIPVRNYTRSWTTVLAAHGAGTRVDLRALTLDANHLSSANLLSAAVYTDGASGRLDEVDLLGAGAMTPNGAQGHMALAAIGRGSLSPSQVWLYRCRISGWNKTGVYLGGFGLSADVRQCEVIGAGMLGAGQAAQNGIQLEEGVTYTLINNTIRDVWYTPGSFNACAILAFDTRGTVELRANRIFNSKTAIYYQSAQGVSATVEGNIIGNCRWGLSAETDGVTAQRNRFDSHFGVYARGLSVVALDKNQYSDFRNNPGYPTRYVTGGNTANADFNVETGFRGFNSGTKIAQPTGAGPNDIATADFNADGFLDFVTCHQLSNFVRIYFGAGNGQFSIIPPKDYPVPGGPVFLATGEFSGNLGTDIAVVSGNGEVRLLSNVGQTGNFALSLPYDIDGVANNATPTSLCAGQLDGIHEDDIAVGFAGDGLNVDGGVLILSVNNAFMTPGPSLPGATRSVQDCVVADVDGDGRDDIAAVDAGNLNGTVNAVQLWLQSTPGSFAAPAQLTIGAGGSGLAVGDLDVDGDLDLVATCNGDPGCVHVFEGDGSGSFAEAGMSPWLVPADPAKVAIADLQNDADFDTERVDVLISYRGENRLTALRGYVNGNFEAYEGAATGLDPASFAVDFVDGNLLPDLLLLNKIDDEVVVYRAQIEAAAHVYGRGCKGGATGNEPEIFTLGDPDVPILNTTGTRIGISAARPASIAVLPFGISEFGNAAPCTAQINGIWWIPAAITDNSGRGIFNFPGVPNDPGFRGINLYCQWFVLDPQGALAGSLATSPGLRLRIGN